MTNVILLVFEGKRAEPNIFKSIKAIFFKNERSPFFYYIWDAEIFQLWKEIRKDSFLDIKSLLKERSKDPDFKKIPVDAISEIHLFFDYDGHSHPEERNYSEVIKSMISFFNNETENGKIYISYPMTEALKDCNSDMNSCFDCKVYIKEFIKYKAIVNKRSSFNDYRKYTINIWEYLIKVHVLRAAAIVGIDKEEISIIEAKSITQEDIFENQYNKYLKPQFCLAVLSAFPFFIISWFKEDAIAIRFFKNIKNCSFYCLK